MLAVTEGVHSSIIGEDSGFVAPIVLWGLPRQKARKRLRYIKRVEAIYPRESVFHIVLAWNMRKYLFISIDRPEILRCGNTMIIEAATAARVRIRLALSV